MIRRAREMAGEVRERMRGGMGRVELCHLEKESLPGNARLFAKLTLEPGCSIGEHEHIGEAEMFYFISGCGVVTDDGERIPVRAGDSMTTLGGHRHSVENTGEEALAIVAVIVRE